MTASAAALAQLADLRQVVAILARIGARIQADVQDPPELVAHLHLGERVESTLRDAGIVRVADLLQRTEADLLRVHYFGRQALRRVKQALAQHGLHLAAPPGQPPDRCTCDPKRWRNVPADRIRHEPTCPRRIKSPR